MSVARLRLAPVRETIFPSRAPFFGDRLSSRAAEIAAWAENTRGETGRASGLVEVYGEKGRRFKEQDVELAQDIAGEVSEILKQLEPN